jgi:hypothetical protein
MRSVLPTYQNIFFAYYSESDESHERTRLGQSRFKSNASKPTRSLLHSQHVTGRKQKKVFMLGAALTSCGRYADKRSMSADNFQGTAAPHAKCYMSAVTVKWRVGYVSEARVHNAKYSPPPPCSLPYGYLWLPFRQSLSWVCISLHTVSSGLSH